MSSPVRPELTPPAWPGLTSQITSRLLNVNDLQMHILEVVPAQQIHGTPQHTNQANKHPLILLLHGFPELAYSWRKVMVSLSEKHEGYHVVAPDMRGFGRTIISIAPFHILSIVADIRSLVEALGYGSVALLVGHDFGSLVAGHCAVAYPKLVKSVVFMSAPFTGVAGNIGTLSPSTSSRSGPSADDNKTSAPPPSTPLSAALAALAPPRKHYTHYFSSCNANSDMRTSQGGLHAFLRAYFHAKSGDWPGNDPHPLPSSTSSTSPLSLAKDLLHLPEYYVMPLHANMPEVVAQIATSFVDLTSQGWLSDEEISVYATEYRRTGFQGGLNYYRSMVAPTSPEWSDEVCALIGRRVGVPAAFIAGSRDWNIYQVPGAEKKMRELMLGADDSSFVLVPDAGHWVQQEAPEEVVSAIVNFLTRVTTSSCGELHDCKQ
ncbi:hypothetical protein SERLADRAFT_359545 [Serpula lacrymans var. lacrymans S7.9]|uniref:AB hydrolase-1 domain-containing protein n=1 Tax=Serpula lacrymans var. lacrymans (strain S7.9) TaxID=578457 RepID=F8NJA6_SERL9|nr:uncharacterized protein SERLADRAFT_359545 [Serpula lacrymans var. lacrymans S7.9]EGO29590.1 hypothetical protein SERLADRAFT_359545 [Serpula lacrymans var. lacrymans S7.9]